MPDNDLWQGGDAGQQQAVKHWRGISNFKETGGSMREVRFKIWNKTEKKWERPDDFATCLNNDDILRYTGLHDSAWEIADEAEYELVQCTGLQDKDNKKIFEGGIVRIADRFTGQVFERLGCWFVEMGKELGYYPKQDIEIIGNIYENPELVANSE